MHPKQLSINDFTYELPDQKIAKFPLETRDESKLLIYKNGDIADDIYAYLPSHLPEKSFLVFNNTKVVEARLLFEKESGSTVELFCLEPADDYSDITTAMLQKQKVLWKCLIGGAKKWKEGLLRKAIPNHQNKYLNAQKVEKRNDYFLIEFTWEDPDLSFAEILHLLGQIPLPPYLNRKAEEKDKETYQTVYAKYEGSVAAPTAGLHFTETLLQNLKNRNIHSSFVTLHVGAGTFKPVKADSMQAHEMHAEFIDVSLLFLEELLHNISEKIVVVGTTSMRTVESLYWMGVKVLSKMEDYTMVSQWEPYELPQHFSATESLNALIGVLKDKNATRLLARTQIIIAPGYPLQIVDGLITNFHQPKSTLLLLVAAVVGNDWKKIYQHALNQDYRFLSYGDGSLLWKN